ELTDQVGAGDICAIPKLTATTTNATLCDKDAVILYDPIDFPPPSFSVAIEPSSKADLDKLATALHKLTDQDPTIHVRREDATHETILSAIGESAIEVAVHHLRDKFGVQVEVRTPRVPYRESIRTKAQAQGRYKRQTGGHGQFGDVHLEIEPQPAGSGVVYATRIVGGSVPRNFWPAVEKGVRETALRGVIAGYPLSDFKATLFDGSFHAVDSSEMSFKIAGSLALQNCVKEAQPFLLAPIMDLEVLVPEEQTGDVLASAACTPSQTVPSPSTLPVPSSSVQPVARAPASVRVNLYDQGLRLEIPAQWTWNAGSGFINRATTRYFFSANGPLTDLPEV